MIEQDFYKLCEEGRICPRGTLRSNRCSKELKRERCYKKYMESQVVENTIDEKWEEVKKKVWERDNNTCQCTRAMSIIECNKLKTGDSNTPSIKDVCHVVPRSLCKKLYYDMDNLVLMCRLFHDRLDSYKHPVTGESISREERDCWWVRIIGRERWSKIQEVFRQPTFFDEE